MDEGPNLSPPDPPSETSTFRAFKREQLLFNRYQLQYELGRGGRGVVWLAHDRRLECSVALKFLADQLLTEPDALDELRHETLLSRKITHPHIMRIYDFEQDDAAAAISMEYVNGCTLSQLRLRRPHYCFSPDELRPWIIELCEALHYAHTGPKVVHRDLKPSNLMISNDGHLKVTDFGIASVIADSMSRVTQIHGVSGTLGYMSPQQALGGKARETDDVYSVGAVIYELLTSKPPFFRGNITAQIQSAIPPLMQERRTELKREGDPIPPFWEDVVASCLAKNPQDRPPDAKVVADWIRDGFRSGEDMAANLTLPLPPAPPAPKTSRLVSPMVFAGAFLLGGGIVWMAVHSSWFRSPAPQIEIAAATPQPGESEPTPPVDTKPPATPEPEPAKPPIPPVGTFTVNTLPSNAEVYLDDVKKGTSPLRLQGVPIGSALLRIERDGYERTELYVDVREDGTQVPLIPLVAKPLPATPTPIPVPPTRQSTPTPNDDPGIRQLVTSYQKALESPDVANFVSLCAPQVDFFDEGVKTPEAIRKSRLGFMKLWSEYHVSNLRGITIKDGADSVSKRISFTYEYRALYRGKGDAKSGTVTDTLDVRMIDGRWLLTKLRQVKG